MRKEGGREDEVKGIGLNNLLFFYQLPLAITS